jgi:CheY-like chemotaxis protein
MGGKIAVESREGRGTTFSFSIQVGVDVDPPKPFANFNMSEMVGKRVLIVDDNSTSLEILRMQLLEWNLVPVVARTVKEVEVILSTETFDLALVDLQMPDMDGMQLARRIKDVHPKLAIILLCSLGDERARNSSDLFSAILAKPVKQSMLCKHILSGLQNQSSTRQKIRNTKSMLSSAFALKHPMQILVAEDNPVNQKLAARVLEKLGYIAHIANNGLRAVEAMNVLPYDLILMDVQMPEMDGLEATRQIVKRWPQPERPHIIAMTANAMEGDREMCIAAGMDDYISKPIRPAALITALETGAVSKNQQGDNVQ